MSDTLATLAKKYNLPTRKSAPRGAARTKHRAPKIDSAWLLAERKRWVENDEPLYRAWKESGQSLEHFVAAHHAKIDGVRKGHHEAGYRPDARSTFAKTHKPKKARKAPKRAAAKKGKAPKRAVATKSNKAPKRAAKKGKAKASKHRGSGMVAHPLDRNGNPYGPGMLKIWAKRNNIPLYRIRKA